MYQVPVKKNCFLEEKTRTKVEEERFRHCQSRRRRLKGGFQNLNTLLQFSLAKKRHGQIINGLLVVEKKKKTSAVQRSWQSKQVTSELRRY